MSSGTRAQRSLIKIPERRPIENTMNQPIIARCEAKGLRMTTPRRVIARVLQDSDDHPDVEELYSRANAIDSGISIATYR